MDVPQSSLIYSMIFFRSFKINTSAPDWDDNIVSLFRAIDFATELYKYERATDLLAPFPHVGSFLDEPALCDSPNGVSVAVATGGGRLPTRRDPLGRGILDLTDIPGSREGNRIVGLVNVWGMDEPAAIPGVCLRVNLFFVAGVEAFTCGP